MPKLSIRDLDLKGNRVFIRVDFNVPIKHGRVDDDSRITASLPTIQYATEQGARVILASHLGRPKGRPAAKYSLAPVSGRLDRGDALLLYTDGMVEEPRLDIDLGIDRMLDGESLAHFVPRFVHRAAEDRGIGVEPEGNGRDQPGEPLLEHAYPERHGLAGADPDAELVLRGALEA